MEELRTKKLVELVRIKLDRRNKVKNAKRNLEGFKRLQQKAADKFLKVCKYKKTADEVLCKSALNYHMVKEALKEIKYKNRRENECNEHKEENITYFLADILPCGVDFLQETINIELMKYNFIKWSDKHLQTETAVRELMLKINRLLRMQEKDAFLCDNNKSREDKLIFSVSNTWCISFQKGSINGKQDKYFTVIITHDNTEAIFISP